MNNQEINQRPGYLKIVKLSSLVSLGIVFLLSTAVLVENFSAILDLADRLDIFSGLFGPGWEAPFILGVIVSFLLPLVCAGLVVIGLRLPSKLFFLSSSIAFGAVILLSWAPSLISYQFYETNAFLLGASNFPAVYEVDPYWGERLVESTPSLAEILLLALVLVQVVLSVFGLITLNPNAKVSKWVSSLARQTGGANQSFLRSLFDLSFDNFIYVKVSKFLYFVTIILHGLVGVAVLIFPLWNLTQSYPLVDPVLGFIVVPFVFLGLLLSLIISRLALESGVALIKIAENTKRR